LDAGFFNRNPSSAETETNRAEYETKLWPMSKKHD